LLGWKQGDVVNYVTNCFSVGSVSNMYVVMNKSKWDSLPADVQKIFDEVSQAWAEYHAKVSSAYDQGGMEYFNAQPNRKEINQDAAESARWAEKVKPLVDETISSIKSKGLPGDEYEQYIRDRIKYWTEKAVSDADCLKWVKDNVKKP
jgi:TRAP-type C4-dicarboxylate transport system substrate-binding protein